MPDDNQTQSTNTPPVETQNTETPNSVSVDQSIPMTDSTPLDTPSEPQNSPLDVIDTPSNKDQNQARVPVSAEMTNSEETVFGVETKVENVGTEAFPSGAERAEETPQASSRLTPTFNTNNRSFLASLLSKMKEKLSFRTEMRLTKILELAKRKNKITNDDVQKLLRVSDASAGRYLAKLVQRGSLKVSGSKNHENYLAN